MLHLHVVVHVLSAVPDEQAVDQAFAALAGQHRVHIVAHQSSAQQHRVRTDTRAASLLDAQRGDVKHLRILAFDSVVVKHRVLARDHLGHDAGERHARSQRDIVLEDRGLAVLFGHDQVARVRHQWCLAADIEIQKIDGLLEHHAPRDEHERAILEERRVQRRKGLLAVIGVAGEMRFDLFPLLQDRFGEAGNLQPFVSQRQAREPRRVPPVHKH